MRCPNCGIIIQDREDKCPVCGYAVRRAYGGQGGWNWKDDPLLMPSYNDNDHGHDHNQRFIVALVAVLIVFILVSGFGAVYLSVKKQNGDLGENVQASVEPAESGQDSEQMQDSAQDPQQTQETAQNAEQSPEILQNKEQSQETEQNTEQSREDSEPAEKEQEASGETAEASGEKAKGAAAESDSDLYYFRTILEGEELELYDALYEISRVDAQDTEIEFYVSIDPASEGFSDMFSKARSFMAADHPELFYISYYYYEYMGTPEENGKYKVIIRPGDFTPSDHTQEVEEMERAADELLSEVDTSQTPARIALQIHDKIMELVHYDYETFENSSEHEGDWAYYAYGALVANSSGEPNAAVCSGYAAAYEYLLQKEGIKAIVISGDAWSEFDEGGPHSWNMVELDGDWYETDCTWDDNVYDSHGSEEDDILIEAISDDWYRNTIDHYLFQVTSEYIENFDPGDDFTYSSDRGWATFLGSSGRSRNTWDDVGVSHDYATLYAPVAEGTEYSYENIR